MITITNSLSPDPISRTGQAIGESTTLNLADKVATLRPLTCDHATDRHFSAYRPFAPSSVSKGEAALLAFLAA